MEDGMPEALEVAQEIIGDNDSEALAEYLERIFELV
jgi:hydroxymethylpyrimidine pyrophosphatase-like HAD family hydrolase